MEQLRRKMMKMKMVVMIDEDGEDDEAYVDRASLRMSISSLSRSGKRMSWPPLILDNGGGADDGDDGDS